MTATPYRVLYMHDAQNLFDPALSSFNKVWAADKAMMAQAATHEENAWAQRLRDEFDWVLD